METLQIAELLGLSFTNRMLILAEVMQEPNGEYYISMHEGQVHIERVEGDLEDEGEIFHGFELMDALGGSYTEEGNFHEIYIYQTQSHWKVTGTSYLKDYQFLLDAGYQGKEYISFYLEGRPLVVEEVEEWVVNHTIKLCKEYREGSVTEDKVVTPYCQFRKEDGVWRKYE